jgi:hypothetical protein
MISCVVDYTIDPLKVDLFEEYARRWMAAVVRLGGTHHGYFLPGKDGGDRAVCIFSFPSMADYKAYRLRVADDPECIAILEQEKGGAKHHKLYRVLLSAASARGRSAHLTADRTGPGFGG